MSTWIEIQLIPIRLYRSTVDPNRMMSTSIRFVWNMCRKNWKRVAYGVRLAATVRWRACIVCRIHHIIGSFATRTDRKSHSYYKVYGSVDCNCWHSSRCLLSSDVDAAINGLSSNILGNQRLYADRANRREKNKCGATVSVRNSPIWKPNEEVELQMARRLVSPASIAPLGIITSIRFLFSICIWVADTSSIRTQCRWSFSM